jgi:hypothetical protein
MVPLLKTPSMKTVLTLTTVAVSLVYLATASGCNQQTFGLGSESQNFGQKAMYNTQVDVLWVIDTSSSMDIYQNQLAPQMGLFVDAMNQTGLDYHMAVTTMDMSGSGNKGKFVAAAGTPLILTSQTPNLTQILSQRIQLGGNGSPVERGLEAMKASLSSPLASASGSNAGFLRKDAMLVVVFLSNEDDQSASADYGAFLDGIRPPITLTGERSWLAQFMGVTDTDSSCKTSAWSQAGYSEVGAKYIALANESGGTSEAICDADLKRALTNVKARILEVITEFHLDRVPNLTTLGVYVNGTLVPQDATNGWTYYSSANSVRFHGSSVPPVDASIRIDYDPTGIK